MCSQRELPATIPEEIVAMTGLCLELMLLNGLNISPSLAIANSTRGIGNMDPSRLSSSKQIALQYCFFSLTL